MMINIKLVTWLLLLLIVIDFLFFWRLPLVAFIGSLVITLYLFIVLCIGIVQWVVGDYKKGKK